MDSRNVILLPLLSFTVALALFPWLEYILDRCEIPSAYPVDVADVGFSVASFIFASCAVLAVFVEDAREARSYFPTQWPTDVFHWVGVSFASALINQREEKHAWYEFLSVVLGMVTCAACLFAMKSYTNQWYVGSSWVDRVYDGLTEPYSDVMRLTNAGWMRKESFYVRFACAIACFTSEFCASFARAIRFSLTRCGSRRSKGLYLFPCIAKNALGIWCPSRAECKRACSWIGIMYVASAAFWAFLFTQLALAFYPYPRWVAYDSRHVWLFAGLAYFCTPQEKKLSDTEARLGLLLLVCGVFMSSYFTARTFQDVVRIGVSPFSYADYAEEFSKGPESFLGIHQYVTTISKDWFAFGAASTHVSDFACCVLGSALLAYASARYWDSQHRNDGSGGNASEKNIRSDPSRLENRSRSSDRSVKKLATRSNQSNSSSTNGFSKRR